MFCTKCGAQNGEAAEFCTSCGNPLKGGSAATSVVGAATGLQRRDPIMVLIFSVITFGIYGIYWQVVTKLEMNASGTQIPTAWLIIIPIVSIWWMWKFSEGIDQVTQGRMTGPVAFLLLFFIGMIGGAIIQDSLNKIAAS